VSDASAVAVNRDALALLSRRPRTAAELREGLTRRGHPSAAIEDAMVTLEQTGQIDDKRLAEHYVVARATRLGHGPRRLVEDLVRRGVRRELARAAWDDAVEHGDLDPAEIVRRQIRRRIGPSRQIDRASYVRVYNALLRAGFGAGAVEAELADLRQDRDEVGDDFA